MASTQAHKAHSALTVWSLLGGNRTELRSQFCCESWPQRQGIRVKGAAGQRPARQGGSQDTWYPGKHEEASSGGGLLQSQGEDDPLPRPLIPLPRTGHRQLFLVALVVGRLNQGPDACLPNALLLRATLVCKILRQGVAKLPGLASKLQVDGISVPPQPAYPPPFGGPENSTEKAGGGRSGAGTGKPSAGRMRRPTEQSGAGGSSPCCCRAPNGPCWACAGAAGAEAKAAPLHSRDGREREANGGLVGSS